MGTNWNWVRWMPGLSVPFQVSFRLVFLKQTNCLDSTFIGLNIFILSLNENLDLNPQNPLPSIQLT
jgi:hypothetical protein